MDTDLALKFAEDKEREVEELCYQLNLAHSSSLTTNVIRIGPVSEPAESKNLNRTKTRKRQEKKPDQKTGQPKST